jgi:hypothetical protein
MTIINFAILLNALAQFFNALGKFFAVFPRRRCRRFTGMVRRFNVLMGFFMPAQKIIYPAQAI